MPDDATVVSPFHPVRDPGLQFECKKSSIRLPLVSMSRFRKSRHSLRVRAELQRSTEQLAERQFDLLVVGGGALGAFAAWDAANRGLRTGLVERGDFASGTTSASGRVLHGGLRSLQYLDPADASLSLREQATIASLVPDLVRPLRFVLPVGTGRWDRTLMRSAAVAWRVIPRALGRHGHLPAPRFHDSARSLEPELRDWAPAGGLDFWDVQIRSPERMVIAVVRAAGEAGATVANRVEATEVMQRNGRLIGVRAVDHESGDAFAIRSTMVLNAAGPWAGRFWNDGTRSANPVAFAIGLHLVTDLPPPVAALGLPWSDDVSSGMFGRGRRMFLLPWEGRTLIGASWAPVAGPPAGAVGPTPERIEGLVAALARRWPKLGLSADRVRFATAGLYPVFERDGADATRSGASRRPLVIDHGKASGPEGLVTAISAKLTTARALAERLVDGFSSRLRASGVPSGPCRTDVMGPLPGGSMHPCPGVPGPVARRENGELIGRYAASEEMARSLLDVVLRRSVDGLRGEAARDVLEGMAAGAGDVLGWDVDRMHREIQEVQDVYRRIGLTAEGGKS